MQMEDAMKARCLVVAMVLTATAVADAKEPLSIRVSPAFSFAPANLVIRTIPQRNRPTASHSVTTVLLHPL
jgi:hypothetical protein